jgi:hypothetical protein
METPVERKKTTTITSETHEVLIVRRSPSQSKLMWCPACGLDVEMLDPEEAAAIASVSTRTIYKWIEAGQVHHAESAGGNVVVCPGQRFLKQIEETSSNCG